NDSTDVKAIAGGCLALKADVTIAAWGENGWSQANTPDGLSNVVAIACGEAHSLALKADGTVVDWGAFLVSGGAGDAHVSVNRYPHDLTNVIAIAAGSTHSLALKDDGSVIAWGVNNLGGINLPPGLTNVVAIVGGGFT